MSTRRRSREARHKNRSQDKHMKGIVILVATFLLIASIFGYNFYLSKGIRKIDPISLCPVEPTSSDSITAVLIDISDSLSVAQKKDLQNQLDMLRDTIPRYGRLEIYTVSDPGSSLLSPNVSLCNPGRGREIDPLTGNPKQVEQKWKKGFDTPVNSAIDGLVDKSPQRSSEILKSIQSVTLTGLRTRERYNLEHKLVIVSDLMQNTPDANFYKGIPKAKDFLQSKAFQDAISDLKNVEVEIWMINRNNPAQERQLLSLWDNLLKAQGAVLTRVYRI